MSTSVAIAPARSPVKGWLAVLAVTLGIFSLMTSELLPVGLLTPVGSALHVSEGVAGLMVTVPGLVAAFSAPIVTVVTGRIDRRIVLAVLIGLMGAANLASGFATNFAVVLIARFLIGLSVGGFWSIAGGIAVRLVPEHQAARATAVIFGGVETASVLGIPAGTVLGDLSGWRVAFAAVGALGLFSVVCMVFLLPALPTEESIELRDLPTVFRSNTALRLALALTFLMITGHFLAYTFVRPILHTHGIDEHATGALLLIFGVAGICGNFLAGTLVSKSLRGTTIAIAVALATATTALALLDTNTVTAAALLILWGLGYGAVPVTFQTRVLRAAPATPEPASSLYVSTFNLSIALGALVGGAVVDQYGPLSVLWPATALVLAALLILALSRRTARQPSGGARYSSA
ncbi:MFS transporter [Nocardia sp. CDC153]|uniref:MFS transporter n=1 Tax=Nocardia sp. CDC153 TaxID=3112167 RepID=UPI002DB93DDA|nr:MFS transporter [Nocardia sp. CDC153]MEC3957662.1 MFS transporter [Nocardia sp. CDC153]